MTIEFTREKIDRAIELAKNPILKTKAVGEIQGRWTRANRGAPWPRAGGTTMDNEGGLAGAPLRHRRGLLQFLLSHFRVTSLLMGIYIYDNLTNYIMWHNRFYNLGRLYACLVRCLTCHTFSNFYV
jgi:hypothetical protein